MSSTISQKSIAITRPVGQGEDTVAFARKLGWVPFLLHTVELRPLERSIVFDEFSRIIREGPVDWLVFMSTVGVDSFFDMLESHSSVLSSVLGQLRIIAVGPRTGAALKNHRVQDVIVPEDYTSNAIADRLSNVDLARQRIVLVRSSAADRHLANTLESRGATVETIVTYEAAIPTNRESVKDFLLGLRKGRFPAVLFTSAASTVNLFRMAEQDIPTSELRELLRSRLVGAIGPKTAAMLREIGIEPAVPRRYLIEYAINHLVKKYENSRAAQALVASE